MAEPNWAQVLAVIYNTGSEIRLPVELEDLSESHLLVQNTNLTGQQVVEAIGFLQGMELVRVSTIPDEDAKRDNYGDPTEASHQELKIRKKGFDVAHDREQGIRQEASSTSIAALTSVLVVTALIEASVGYSSASGARETLFIGTMLFGAALLFVLIWYGIYKVGLFDLAELKVRKQRYE